MTFFGGVRDRPSSSANHLVPIDALDDNDGADRDEPIPPSFWDSDVFVVWVDVRTCWTDSEVIADEHFAECLQYISAEELERLRKFHFRLDAAQHLASLLLQHHVIRHLTGVPWRNSFISRTILGRPYFHGARFDYNVSHHSGRVAIGVRLADRRSIGVDLVDPKEASKRWKPGWMDDFTEVFTDREYDQILYGDTTENDPIAKRRLFSFWALKEAYIKATGSGLVTNLKAIEFSSVEDVNLDFKPYTNKIVCIRSSELLDWRFELFALEDGLIFAVATPNDGLLEDQTKIKKICIQDVLKNAETVNPTQVVTSGNA
ncbi:hypothetical protein V1512DRAFT_262074 [Lipomyces arxii]|uniref:uncharacterized protein n=1 Tax=Lipomyces arxii TaxID=56418 RepID=UPI0034CFA8C5